ncbi:caspase family protein [Solirubrobacter sp. CPCC 204708]|uniref:Caspase family protein n=1 Tax=Solirubrobacter deserti TaxID=2282478 RepID=A0ABT4RT34_9ACTN|nr:caspase family protein [Solirubrobacter deserti]MBE2315680.1 caspase family protein [Solirubrobacter deserti]MDA0141742.1 caspase family protein [Solirubrobacter deserti]
MPHRALIIGNWEYADPTGVYAPLNGPRHDVRLMQEALEDPKFGLCEEIQVLCNATWNELQTSIAEFIDHNGPDDHMVLYYSGHGARIEEGRLALCGVDTPSQQESYRGFDTAKLREWLQVRNRARSTVVVLDCCYAGAYKSATLEISDSLGAGTGVLASGGNQPAKDSQDVNEPSPFTAALASILLDPEVPGRPDDGMVTLETVYTRLLEHQPRLDPLPQRNVRSQGSLPLAKREIPSRVSRPELVDYEEPRIDPITLRFDRASVVAQSSAGEPESIDLSGRDDHQWSAVRRMSQLADAVVRVPDYDSDRWAQRAVRRAWNCVGSTLFERALPPGVQERIRALDETEASRSLLKLRLHFGDGRDESGMQRYPWEYLYHQPDPGYDDDIRPEPQPMALQPGLLVERVIVGTPPSEIKSPVAVGLVNSQRGQLGDAAGRVADGLTQMVGLNVVFDARAEDAQWGRVLDSLGAQRPKLLLMCLPVRRRPGGVEVAFWPEREDAPDWRRVQDLIVQLRRRNLKFDLIFFSAFAARPSTDSYRATNEVAGELARAGLGPVIFVCHSAAHARLVPPLGKDTFTLLLMDAVTQGKRLDYAVYYAKDRVASRVGEESRRTFGVPGYYVIEDANAQAEPEPEFESEPRTAGRRTVGRAGPLRREVKP